MKLLYILSAVRDQLAGTHEIEIQQVEQIRSIIWRIFAHVVLFIIAVVSIGPIVYAFLTSLKPPNQILVTAFDIIPNQISFYNYTTFWSRFPFDRWMLNSFIISSGSVFISVVLDSMAGFALAKGRFKGRYAIYLLVIGTLVIPPQSIIVPLFLGLDWIGWVNTYWGMMILAIADPFGTFLMRQYYISTPDSLIESARIDGCSNWQIYTRIMLPLGKPALASLVVFKFIFIWGAFLWPLIVTNSSAMYPLQVGLGLFEGQYGDVEWGLLLAAAISTAAPVMIAYIYAQDAFMEGVALRGRKA